MDQRTCPEKPLPPALPNGREPLRVGILSYRSSPHVGGQGIYLEYLTRALLEFGHSVDVISGPPYPELDPRVRLIELPSLDLYAQRFHGHLSLRPRHLLSATDTYEYFGHLSGKFVEPYTFGQRALAYLKQHAGDYDVLLDNQTLAEGVLRIQDDLGVPLVTMIHHPITKDRRLDLEAEPRFRRRLLIRRWYAFHRMQVRVARSLNHVICPSESAKAHIAEEFGVDPNRITPIRVGVDRDHFRPDPNVAKVPNRIVTTASADVPMKGLPILIQAYHDLLQNRPDVELRVIGKLREGPTRTLIEKLGLNDRVTFKSGLSRAELADEFRAASILVSPSLYEGFGLPAAEAMSCGTAVIVTDGGALPEVAGDAGIVVPKGEPRALTAAIDSLLGDRGMLEATADACLSRAEQAFDWANIAPLYDDTFRQAMASPC